jgi:hypothetical protein
MIDISRAIHVDEILGGWLLRREDTEPIATYRQRDEAVRIAAGMARAAGGGTIVIRSRDGSVDTLAVAEGTTEEPPELSELDDRGAAPSDLQLGDAEESTL